MGLLFQFVKDYEKKFWSDFRIQSLMTFKKFDLLKSYVEFEQDKVFLSKSVLITPIHFAPSHFFMEVFIPKGRKYKGSA